MFRDKVVLITGASSGIGAGTAISLAKQGAQLSLVGRNIEKLKNVVAECEMVGENKPLIIISDVSDNASASDIIKKTLERFNRLDILVNNAGIGSTGHIYDDMALETYDKVMSINMRAVVQLTNLAVPHLIKFNGNIVNVSSMGSKISNGLCWAYCVSKAALDHFTKCIAIDLAPKGVRVNAVNPGYVQTDIVKNMGLSEDESNTYYEEIAKTTPLKKICDLDEVVDLIIYLASDRARSITGTTILIDNGATLEGSTAMKGKDFKGSETQ